MTTTNDPHLETNIENSVDYWKITKSGLWTNNSSLVQVLGLCPLLAVSGSVVNGLGMGIATVVVLTGSNICVSLIRNQITDAVRLPAFVMIIAALTTCIQLLMQAFAFEMYEILGIFIALIVTNCIIIGRAEAFASKNGVLASAADGFMMGMGLLAVLVVLGAMREVIGQGVIFSNMNLLLGESFADSKIVVFENYKNFLFAILPPGAFVGLGLIIAAKNVIDKNLKALADAKKEQVLKGSKRVRTTGLIS
jgi:Na+-translocating ferredoxin:NAD+ oxidoreductase subunit E